MNERLIRCSGVPEHFNYPWRTLTNTSIAFQWAEDPAGTGSLSKKLANNELDIAILLLDGAIKNYRSSNFKILSFYINTPIVWGVYAHAQSTLTKETLIDPSFAISRYTSGSHLMAFLYAQEKGLQLSSSSFKLAGDLKGAVKALEKNRNQLFLWEKFTTKPYVDQGIFKCIDYCSTPWPAFVVAVNNKSYQEKPEAICSLIHQVQKHAQQIQSSDKTIANIAQAYQLKEEDIAAWIKGMEWTTDMDINEEPVLKASRILQELGIIEHIPTMSDLLHT